MKELRSAVGPGFRLTGSSHKIFAFWLALSVCILAVKSVLLALDSTPLFTMGDSGVYLASALSLIRSPGERSFTYGAAIIYPMVAAFGTLKAVVIVQGLLACGSALLLAGCMRVGFRAPLWLAAIAGLVYTVEPLGLLYERMIMTEGSALFVLALFVFFGLRYIERPGMGHLAILAVLGVCAVSLRTVVIPVVLVSMAILPIIALFDKEARYSRLLAHLVFSLLLTWGVHATYKQYFAHVTGHPPSYNSGDGFFLFAGWAPLIRREDFPDPKVYDRLAPTVTANRADRFNRALHRFSDNGWVDRLLADQSDYHRANELAKAVALTAGRRDPGGVLVLGWRTYLDYWDRDRMHRSIRTEQGDREIDQWLIDYFKTRHAQDISQAHLRDSTIKQWYRNAVEWYRLLLLGPLLAIATLFLVPQHRRAALFIGMLVIGLMGANCLFNVGSYVRFLHSIEWLVTLQCGAVLVSLHRCVALRMSSRWAYEKRGS